MPGDVSVYVRIRPPLAGEPREAAATVLNKETVRLEVARTATVCEHGCDAAFGPQASQAELFDGVARDVVDAVLAGNASKVKTLVKRGVDVDALVEVPKADHTVAEG